MTSNPDTEVTQMLDMQARIARRLDELGFSDKESRGQIIHHLAEVVILGKKLATNSLPKFLSSPPHSEDLADVIVEIHEDLDEVGEAISDMQPSLTKLMNFMNP